MGGLGTSRVLQLGFRVSGLGFRVLLQAKGPGANQSVQVGLLALGGVRPWGAVASLNRRALANFRVQTGLRRDLGLRAPDSKTQTLQNRRP